MAGSKSDYLENKLLDHALGTTTFTKPSAVYVALYTAAPTDAGGGTEVSGNNYSRVAATFSAASGGATANATDVIFPTPSGSWGTIVAFGLFDQSTTGNLLYWGDLTANQAVALNDTVQFLTGEIDITEA